MTVKLTLAAALLLGASLGLTTVSSAQVYYSRGYGQNYYDYAPGPGFAPYNYGPSPNDCERGGPGPRVGCGSGLGIGSQR